jgi:8-oxo-dGTP pyrophosphatase MutT (NUDIX family)
MVSFVSGMKISKEDIQQALQHHLLGEEAHVTIMSYNRPPASEARKMPNKPRESAVMMLIFPYQSELCTAFTLRHTYEGAHSNQISFPGGKKEESDESHLQTAIRETREEVGCEVLPHQIIGLLSELYIPPSHFLVQPYVAWLEETPVFSPEAREVKEILIEPLSAFFQENILHETEVFIPAYNRTLKVPAFHVQGKVLWGATAMMMQEFRFSCMKAFPI